MTRNQKPCSYKPSQKQRKIGEQASLWKIPCHHLCETRFWSLLIKLLLPTWLSWQTGRFWKPFRLQTFRYHFVKLLGSLADVKVKNRRGVNISIIQLWPVIPCGSTWSLNHKKFQEFPSSFVLCKGFSTLALLTFKLDNSLLWEAICALFGSLFGLCPLASSSTPLSCQPKCQ